jgi:hypothetical protein
MNRSSTFLERRQYSNFIIRWFLFKCDWGKFWQGVLSRSDMDESDLEAKWNKTKARNSEVRLFKVPGVSFPLTWMILPREADDDSDQKVLWWLTWIFRRPLEGWHMLYLSFLNVLHLDWLSPTYWSNRSFSIRVRVRVRVRWLQLRIFQPPKTSLSSDSYLISLSCSRSL